MRRVRDLSCGDMRVFVEIQVRRIDCRACGKVKSERLDFLADNPFYTKRFAYYVGRRCRQSTQVKPERTSSTVFLSHVLVGFRSWLARL